MPKLFKITGKDRDNNFDYNSNVPTEVLCYCDEYHVDKLTEHFKDFPSAFSEEQKKYRSVESTEIQLTYL